MDAQKEQHVQNLYGLGSGKSETEIRALLEHHNWNPDAAAGALFDTSGATEESTWTGGGWPETEPNPADWIEPTTNLDGSYKPPSTPEPQPERGRKIERRNISNSNESYDRSSNDHDQTTQVIDLTSEDHDEDLSKALQMSLEGVQETTTFGPSNRAPSVHWAMVPSNVAVGGTDEDQDVSRAVEASLNEAYQEDVYEELPPEEQIRKGGRPLALRTPNAAMCYGGLLLQALYYVPQVRQRVAAYRWQSDSDFEAEANSLAQQVTYVIQQFFVLMEFGQMAYYAISPSMFAFKNASALQGVDDLTEDLFESLTGALEEMLFKRTLMELRTMAAEDTHGDEKTSVQTWPRLFHFRQASPSMFITTPGIIQNADRSYVRVEHDPSSPLKSDLVTCLTSEYLIGDIQKRAVIQYPSDVIAISVHRKDVHNVKREAFRYPQHFYLDRFLAESAEITESKLQQESQMNAEIVKLEEEKKNITVYENQDVLKSLQASLYYLEEVTESRHDPARAEKNAEACVKLREVIAQLESKLQSIETSMEHLRHDSIGVFDCPELQNNRYDLRAVLYQDGFFGRDHVYSYVRDYHTNTWWKTVDHNVTEVTEETVLNDGTGVHVGGGPFLLLYSRAIDEDNSMDSSMLCSWPEPRVVDIKQENASFREKLPSEMASHLEGLEPPDRSNLGSQMDVDE